jgi:DNA-binding transcriptional MerR regulator
MKIGDLARLSGFSTHTIRYYERIGLLPRASRAGSNHREYDQSILAWITFLGALKTTGMPIRDMVRYAVLRAEGASGAPGRRALLVEHRAKIRAHLAELQACLAVLDTKIAGYAGQQGTHETNDQPTEHDDNLGRTLHKGARRTC